MLVALGIVEYGYDFLAFHMVTHATSVGARAASALQHDCGSFTSAQESQIASIVTTQTGNIATINSVTVTPNPTAAGCPLPAGTIPQVTVTVQASVPRPFGGFVGPPTLDITRTETFRDEAL
jgi:Flp pilus assembly protein TadG